jgi:hypothetical protein
MDIDQYYAHVGDFAAQMIPLEGDDELFVPHLKENSQVAEDCAAFRESQLTQADVNRLKGYLGIGYFEYTPPKPLRTIAWWAFRLDIYNAASHLLLRAECALYDRSQPLFRARPRLFNAIRAREETGEPGEPGFEMIDDTHVTHIDGEIYGVGAGFAKLSPSLPRNIPILARRQFPNAPRYLRLDPYAYYTEQPLMSLLEAAIVPANPNWLATLAIFTGNEQYAQYDLQGDAAISHQDLIDYTVHGIRRLEIKATRRDDDYLSMMIEELPTPDAEDGLMVGRCIHLDTFAPFGTPMADAQLNHLDLAINVYTYGDRALRMTNTLQHGKAQDATYRRHLYRIETIPFPSVFLFADLFFKSRYLLSEWYSAINVTPGA